MEGRDTDAGRSSQVSWELLPSPDGEGEVVPASTLVALVPSSCRACWWDDLTRRSGVTVPAFTSGDETFSLLNSSHQTLQIVALLWAFAPLFYSHLDRCFLVFAGHSPPFSTARCCLKFLAGQEGGAAEEGPSLTGLSGSVSGLTFNTDVAVVSHHGSTS